MGAPATFAAAPGQVSTHVGGLPGARGAGQPGPETATGGGSLPGVASQLVSVLSPLRATPAGAQTITVLLRPEHLGDVRATITATGDQVVVRLVASTSEGTAVLRGALPDLRNGLADNGQRPVVVLADGGSHQRGFDDGQAGRDTGPTWAPSRSLGHLAATLAPQGSGVQPVRSLARNRLLDVRL